MVQNLQVSNNNTTRGANAEEPDESIIVDLEKKQPVKLKSEGGGQKLFSGLVVGTTINPNASSLSLKQGQKMQRHFVGKPPTYMVFSVVGFLMLPSPLGLAALIYSSRVNAEFEKGRTRKAQKSSDQAKLLNIFNFALAVFAWALVISFIKSPEKEQDSHSRYHHSSIEDSSSINGEPLE